MRHHEEVRALFPAEMRSRVRLLDWMSRDALGKVYDEGGIFVFPSHYEGFAQTFLEAMARGVVVLASRIDGMKEAIRDGENGFLFDSGAAEAIAARAIALIGNPSVATEIGASARRTAERFTWDASAELFEGFVERLRGSERR